MGKLLINATRRVSPAHIRYVRPVLARDATGPVARVYDQIEADFGMLAPPVALHAAAPPVLAACWCILREVLLVPGPAGRDRKEAVASAVSLANKCPYCVEVHGTTLVGLREDADAVAVVSDRLADVTDPRLRALTEWARASGGPDRPPAPFPPAHAPEMIGVALTFHYINRMVNVFLRESPLPAVHGPAQAAVRRTATRIMRSLARNHIPAGTSLDLLPPAPLPPDLAWAQPAPHLAGALARGSAAIEAAGGRSVPVSVRELIGVRLADPSTRPPGPHVGGWLEDAVAPLPAPDRPAGRIALLTAFASYRVTPELIDDFRRSQPTDAALIELTSWAGLATARHIARDLGRDLEVTAR